MSLVGNLEDLSLGDILQIISLSQKSGVLAVSSDQGSGRIVFRTGSVQAACLKGRPNDLRDLLVSIGLIDPAGYDAALSRAKDQGTTIEEVLALEEGLDRDRLDALIQKTAESSILEMFSWSSGEFSFDVRNQLEPEDPQLILAGGVNAQYLAMEGMRLRDEQARKASPPPVSSEDPDPDPEPVDPDAQTQPNADGPLGDAIFGDEPLEIGPIDGESGALLESVELEPPEPGEDRTDALELAELHAAEAPIDPLPDPRLDAPAEAPEAQPEPAVPSPAEKPLPPAAARPSPEATDALVEGVVAKVDADRPTAASRGPSTQSAAAPPAGRPVSDLPVVLIEPDVSVLEWIKSAVRDEFARVHSFQQAEQGLARIRQYLIRGETPVVLLSSETPIDPLSGIHGLTDFVKRLKVQAPRLTVFALAEADSEPPPGLAGSLSGVLSRPPRRQLADPNAGEARSAAEQLCEALCSALGGRRQGAASGGEAGGDDADGLGVRKLREATARLQEASSRGEVLPVVLEFAAELFARVAILIAREAQVFAIAGRGIETLEVDPLDSDPPISLQALDAGWIRRVLETGSAVLGPPETEADHTLLAGFGAARPPAAYLGPIESGSSVVAMLYGDQGDTGAAMPDTSGLEIVLHHASLALDRAALERALWEVDAGRD